jgi:hypothetical protein
MDQLHAIFVKRSQPAGDLHLSSEFTDISCVPIKRQLSQLSQLEPSGLKKGVTKVRWCNCCKLQTLSQHLDPTIRGQDQIRYASNGLSRNCTVQYIHVLRMHMIYTGIALNLHQHQAPVTTAGHY